VLGGVYVSCQYFPCSFVLALRELGLRLGVKAPLPLRASSRGVLPGPGYAKLVAILTFKSHDSAFGESDDRPSENQNCHRPTRYSLLDGPVLTWYMYMIYQLVSNGLLFIWGTGHVKKVETAPMRYACEQRATELQLCCPWLWGPQSTHTKLR
jgi:hypothetical protein